MAIKYKILVITSGGYEGFSGANQKLLNAMSSKNELIGIVDNKLSGFWKYYNRFYCFLKKPGFSKYLQPISEIYNGDTAYYCFRTMCYIIRRTQSAEKLLDKYKNKYDLVLQTGWLPAILEKKDVPHCIYTDFTMKLSEREYPLWSRFLCNNDKKKWLEMETRTYHNAAVVFTMSNHTRQSLIEDYGVSENNVFTVYGGVNLDENPDITKNYNSNTILFVGIDFERKGGYILLDAFKIVKEKIKDARLVIIGSKYKVSIEGVEFKGFISHEEKMYYYNVASVFAMPSIMEPFGLVFLEAMANRIPCIGSMVDAIPEIIEDGITGFLVPPNNPEELAKKLILLLENENLMKIMGDNGRKRVENIFTWDKIVDRMTNEFEKIREL